MYGLELAPNMTLVRRYLLDVSLNHVILPEDRCTLTWRKAFWISHWRNTVGIPRNYCRSQHEDSICGLTAVKPRPRQPKAAVSPRLISAVVIRGRGEDCNRLLLPFFQKATFEASRNETREFALPYFYHFSFAHQSIIDSKKRKKKQ